MGMASSGAALYTDPEKASTLAKKGSTLGWKQQKTKEQTNLKALNR